MSDEENKEDASSSAGVFPVQAGSLKKGTYAMLKGFPCKIVEVTISKTGKHGQDKVRLSGIDIFNGKKYEDAAFSSTNISGFIVNMKNYEFQSCEPDGTVKLLDLATKAIRSDLKIGPDSLEIADQIKVIADSKKKALVTVLEACGKEMIYSCREVC